MKRINRQIRASVIIVVTITTILIVMCLMGLSQIKENQSLKTDEFLTQMNAQYKTAVSKQIKGDMETLQGMASLLKAQGNFDPDSLLEVLRAENENNRFMRMGYIDKNGIAQLVDVDGRTLRDLDFGQMEYVKHVMQGEKVITETMKDSYGSGFINIYAVPIDRDGSVIGALCAVNDAAIYRSILDLPSLGKGFAGIVDKDGDLVIRSKEDPNQSYTNIFQQTFESKQQQKEVMQALEKGESGSYTYQYQKKSYTVYFSPLNINGWTMISVVPASVLTKEMNFISNMAIAAITMIILVLSALLFYIVMIIYRSRKSLEKIAYFDDLTGLYTKNKFLLEANHRLQKNYQGCLILIDIDKFKMINEFFGYACGDAYLCHCAQCLRSHLQEGEVYYRHHADCFGILLKERKEKECIERLYRIIKDICDYQLKENQMYHLSCHCGIKMLEKEEQGSSLDTVIDRAIMALKECKHRENEWYYVYDKKLYEETQHDTYIESRMKQALKEGEFAVYLQPKYDIHGMCIVGAEALVRWNMDGNMILPSEFIPLFERNGFITQLDMYVLDRACMYMEEWDRLGYGIQQINVNQSRLLFYRMDYLRQVEAIMKRHHIDPSRVVLEVTESVALENSEVLMKTIQGIHKLGLHVSMDDFGSGYSSLNVLQELPFDELKLDQVFLRENKKDVKRQKTIVQKIIELSRELGIRTVAEGVETWDQFTFLQEIGCDIAQGYYFSKPVSKEEFDALLKKEKKQQSL